MIGLTNAGDRVEILRRRIYFEQDPNAFIDAYEDAETSLAERIIAARARYELVKYSEKDMYTIAALTSSFKVDGHRADIVILRTARAHAARGKPGTLQRRGALKWVWRRHRRSP